MIRLVAGLILIFCVLLIARVSFGIDIINIGFSGGIVPAEELQKADISNSAKYVAFFIISIPAYFAFLVLVHGSLKILPRASNASYYSRFKSSLLDRE